jgi:hypothetical protein
MTVTHSFSRRPAAEVTEPKTQQEDIHATRTPRNTRSRKELIVEESEAGEGGRRLRKTPARTTRRSTVLHDSDDVENSSELAASSRQSRRRLVAEEAGGTSTPLKPHNVEKVQAVETAKKASNRTPRSKKTFVATTPAVFDDEPMTLDELSGSVKTRSHIAATPKTETKGRSQKIVETPRTGVRTRRMANLLEGHE